MPVYHPRQWTPDIPGEEYHGPLDGVRPKDYPETYKCLLELRCVMTIGERLYQRTVDKYKICDACFLAIPAENQVEFSIVVPHSLVHKDSVHDQTKCSFCYKPVVKVRPASDCRGCIEEYLHTDHEYLNDGWGAPVYARWIRE